MATIKKVRRRKPRLSVILFTMSIFALLYSSLYLNSQTISLTMKKQQLENEVMMLKEQNQMVSMNIQTLQNKDRIYTIAKDSGLQQNQANIISVATGE